VDLGPERDFVAGLGGGFPYHLQVVAYQAFDCKKGSGPLTEDQRLWAGSRAYEQIEPVLTIMWGRLDETERETALAALERQTAAEIDGFTWVVDGRATVVDGLVWRFLSERQRDRGALVADALDSASPDRAMMYGVVRVLMRAVEARDRYARGHADQVARLAVAIAREMGCSEELAEGVRVASRVHDIGRVSISDMILLKPGPLTELETEIMRIHPVVGAQILDAIEFPWAVKPAVRYHHERMDGSGYPEGLVGEEIPLGARIVAVADVMSAMTSDRPYRPAASEEEAVAELTANAGVKYDAAVVAALARAVERGTL
jgi:putative nucleotidyltransferase with HDIG domain